MDADEYHAINNNQTLVAHRGRDPGLHINCQGVEVLLRDKAREVLQAMRPVAEMLNAVHDEDCYTDCLDSQIQVAWNPDIAPSARMLEEMRNNDESFFDFAKRKSQEHRDFFLQRTLQPDLEQSFRQLAEDSLNQQQALEKAEQPDFDSFLQAYFAGTVDSLKI